MTYKEQLPNVGVNLLSKVKGTYMSSIIMRTENLSLKERKELEIKCLIGLMEVIGWGEGKLQIV